MERKVFGEPQPGLAYRDRLGAYGIAFDGRGRAAVVYCERKEIGRASCRERV